MRPFIAILSFIILALTNPVELSSKKSRFLDDASVPFLEAKERPSTSAASKWSWRREKKPEPLPVITLDFCYILRFDQDNRPQVYLLASDKEYPVLTDTTGTKLIGLIIDWQAYHFVISTEEPYQKVALKIIDNVAKETINLEPNYDPLPGCKKGDKESYWHKYIRFARTRRVGYFSAGNI
ncbi:uncharacterized protein LOC117171690 isoform X2 [Belonocnema kinseyi]|uniref:uncharacterized protein LOC117171690 isoform X2 n=1 Tax=Belonocnema kinseyi TaxID=2817044 RepID=UPI00143D7669|nr:uncharacterized protein LOC117171690 isoform X2 [Belonocnema kinseyi]